ncbi:cell cycle checkpoint protein RAD1 [Wyeomyia smithii]|uniref:cell cycle checkpoint protein RAD1 n=1 Tax=Wyeomyia smithii TaxID=174621 RepID=UPI002467C9B6|nr:cell cycle checkpoint protein RAD1 [Wyeomyia smithii]XP_055551059.1 cell cycle checkpoint protein RAD1 [Wyeomyia smithii]
MLNTKPLYEKGLIRDRKMLTQSQFSQIQFSAVLNEFEVFYNVAKAINFVDDSTVQLSTDGVKIVVEESKTIQAALYVTRGCFSEYKIAQRKRKLQPNDETEDAEEPVASFGLNLKAFTDCLSLLIGSGYDSNLKIIYKGEGAPLMVIQKHHGDDDLVTECSVKTMEPLEIVDFDLEDEQSCSKVNVKGPEFFLLLSEIDKNCDEVEMFLSPNNPHFKLTTFGEVSTESCVEITDNSDMLISFQSSRTSNNRYNFAHFKLVMRTLALASQVSLHTNKNGLLKIQVKIANPDNFDIFVEYFIMPQCDDGGTPDEADE